MFFDPLYFLILAPAMLVAGWAAWATRSRFAAFAQVPAPGGLSGAETARRILDRAGLRDVPIEEHPGQLSDHYDPRSRVVRLSPDVYHGRSVSALAVAAHETGHALQHQKHYAPLALRNAAVPLASLGSNASFMLIFLGMIIGSLGLAKVGVVLFGGVVFFQLITLPVEFDASARAKRELESMGIAGSEAAGVRKVLNAAAMTYVAAALTAVLTLVYYLIRLGILGGRDD